MSTGTRSIYMIDTTYYIMLLYSSCSCIWLQAKFVIFTFCVTGWNCKRNGWGDSGILHDDWLLDHVDMLNKHDQVNASLNIMIIDDAVMHTPCRSPKELRQPASLRAEKDSLQCNHTWQILHLTCLTKRVGHGSTSGHICTHGTGMYMCTEHSMNIGTATIEIQCTTHGSKQPGTHPHRMSNNTAVSLSVPRTSCQPIWPQVYKLIGHWTSATWARIIWTERAEGKITVFMLMIITL